MKTKTIFRLVDNLYPRLLTAALFVIVIVCCINTCTATIEGNYSNAAFFGFITFLFCIATDITYKRLWTPKK